MVKKLLYIGIALILCGCEVIKEEDRYIPVSAANGGRSHVLIEYTGFNCVNCPDAAQTALKLQQIYGEQLIVVAMHPPTNHFTQTKNAKYDYTCPEADSCYLFMGGTASTPFPTGNIDIRRTIDGYFLPHEEWAARLTQAMRDTTEVFLSIEAETDSLTRRVAVETQTFSANALSCRLALWLVEDSVPGVQKMPDGTANMNYIHRHMFRSASDNSPWGKTVDIGPSLATQRTEITVPDKCELSRCAVVALLLDGTDYHVLQAKQIELSE